MVVGLAPSASMLPKCHSSSVPTVMSAASPLVTAALASTRRQASSISASVAAAGRVSLTLKGRPVSGRMPA